MLTIEFLRARRYGTPLALFMADLDNFKEVNDEYGHPGGDVVLRAVSEQLLATLRATYVAGRFGGEELLVVLPHNTAQGAAVAAERWRAEVENTAFVVPDGRLISTTISIGTADYRWSFEGPGDLIAAADKVLYLAKQKGRNRVEVYTE